MNANSKHTHDFDESEWPFDQPINTPVFSTKNVVQQGHPILTIARDHEGDWQFLCGNVDDPEDMAIVCFGCMFDMHPFIAEFCDMPKAWIAWRTTSGTIGKMKSSVLTKGEHARFRLGMAISGHHSSDDRVFETAAC